VTATARKIAVLFYNAVRYGMAYIEHGAVQYENNTVSVSSRTYVVEQPNLAAS
jgi:hypothetical protein